jgi:Aromatic-ring-opening dioxygenase LigAB, LigA subunit
MTEKAAYRVHRLIQDVAASADLTKRFNADPEAFFESYGLTAAERERLASGKRDDLMALGVHPNLQMKYVKIRAQPVPGARPPLAHYLDLLKE